MEAHIWDPVRCTYSLFLFILFFSFFDRLLICPPVVIIALYVPMIAMIENNFELQKPFAIDVYREKSKQ